MSKKFHRLALGMATIAAAFALASPVQAEGHPGFGGGAQGSGGFHGAPGGGHPGGGFNGGGHPGGTFNGGAHPGGGFHGGGHPGGNFHGGPRPGGGFNGGGHPGGTLNGGPRPGGGFHNGGHAGAGHMGGGYYGGGPHGHFPHGIAHGGYPHSWGGGYFHGRYWPRSHYHSGFIRFFPVLPAIYATYWFGGVPYYYWDDAYYTWSGDEDGYVATDPPPLESSGVASGTSSADVDQSGDSSSVYAYPKNGQTADQVATDRFQCHQWAVSQTGFDPSNGSAEPAGTSARADYRRAMIACLGARGYSAN